MQPRQSSKEDPSDDLYETLSNELKRVRSKGSSNNDKEWNDDEY